MGAVLADCCKFEQINQSLNQWGIIATVNSTMKLVNYCHNTYAVNISLQTILQNHVTTLALLQVVNV